MDAAATRRTSRASAAIRWGASLVAVAIFVRLLASADLSRAFALIGRIGPRVAVIAVPYFLLICLDALAWRWVFAILGRSIAWGRLVLVRLATEAVLLSVPGGALVAETLKPWLLREQVGVPYAETSATLAAKKVLLVSTQAIYLALAAILGWAGLIAASHPLLHRHGLLPHLVLALAVVLAVTALGMWWVFLFGSVGARMHALLKLVPSKRLRAWLEQRSEGFGDADRHLASVFGTHLIKLASAMLPFFASWLCEALESFVILRLLGAPLTFVEVMSFEAVVSLLRSIVFVVPAGIGVQDVSYVAFLEAFGVPGAIDLGAAFVLLKRAKDLAWIAVGYGVLIALRSGRKAPGPELALPTPTEERDVRNRS